VGSHALAFRRQLRRGSTEAEQALWSQLRGRRFGAKFRRQYTIGPFTLDLFCVERRLAIELDGGGHFLGGGQVADGERDAYLRAQGVRVLRFTNHQVRTELDGVLEVIWSAIQDADAPPHPSPLPRCGGGEGKE